MKFGLIVIIALVVSAFAAHFLLQDPGYVVINFRNYLIEMSVPILLAIMILIIIGIWLLVKVFRAPKKLGQAAGRYRTGRAGQRLTKGMIEVAEGNFARGEKLLARAASTSDAAIVASSPHAVMRHQIQRSTSVMPIPAPSDRLR